MDYAPSRTQEVQSRYSYHQGDTDERPNVQWTAQDNQSYRNATVHGNQEVNVFANNVYIDTGKTNVYQPVQELPPPPQQQVVVQRVSGCYPNNDCYGRDRDIGAEIVGGIIGGVIGGVLMNRHHGGWHRGYEQRWDNRGWNNRGYDDNYYHQHRQRHYPQYQPQYQQNCQPYYGGGYRRHCR